MGYASGLISEAKKSLGLGENPAGSNHNYITEWYNKNIAKIGNGPWCDMSVTYWAAHSGNLGAVGAGKGIGYAYTVYHAQKFQKMGRWHYGTSGIKPGCVVFFDWNGSRKISAIDHVGIVEKVSGSKIYTIEGNKGDKCVRVVRDSKYIVGYGLPKFDTPVVKPKPRPKPVKKPTPKPKVPWPYKSGTLMQLGWHDSEGVWEVQKKLNASGFRPKLVIDGDYGPKTAKAVSWFQAHHYLRMDGIVGKITWNELFNK